MQKQVLLIFEKLRHKRGMAEVEVYDNLGTLYVIRRNLAQAVKMNRKSLGLFPELGMAAKAQQVQEMLDATAEVASSSDKKCQNPLSSSTRTHRLSFPKANNQHGNSADVKVAFLAARMGGDGIKNIQ